MATTYQVLCRGLLCNGVGVRALCTGELAARSTSSAVQLLRRRQRNGVTSYRRRKFSSTSEAPGTDTFPRATDSIGSTANNVVEGSKVNHDVLLDPLMREELNMEDAPRDIRDLLGSDRADAAASGSGEGTTAATAAAGVAGGGGGIDNLLQSKLSELEKLPILLVRCSFNNTYINICDHTGRLITWKSAGSEGYKNSRKGTTFAAQATGLAVALKARELGMNRVRVKLKGPGSGRQYSLKGFELGGLQIASIQDVTPVPHNGCKPRKKRRV